MVKRVVRCGQAPHDGPHTDEQRSTIKFRWIGSNEGQSGEIRGLGDISRADEWAWIAFGGRGRAACGLEFAPG